MSPHLRFHPTSDLTQPQISPHRRFVADFSPRQFPWSCGFQGSTPSLIGGFSSLTSSADWASHQSLVRCSGRARPDLFLLQQTSPSRKRPRAENSSAENTNLKFSAEGVNLGGGWVWSVEDAWFQASFPGERTNLVELGEAKSRWGYLFRDDQSRNIYSEIQTLGDRTPGHSFANEPSFKRSLTMQIAFLIFLCFPVNCRRDIYFELQNLLLPYYTYWGFRLWGGKGDEG